MISFFTHCRAFVGEFDELQRMAIQSWETAAPGCQIILMGNEEGVADICDEFGWKHAPILALNEHGTPLISSAFFVAESLARHELLCEISADIVLGANFMFALEDIAEIERPFVVGQRWDINPGAGYKDAILHPPSALDYFIYRKGTLGEIPPFAIGRTVYDNWLVWAAINRWGLTVIDATEAITAIHVNHGYPRWKNGKSDMLVGQERQENVRLANESGCTKWCGSNDAPFVLKNGRVTERTPERLRAK